MHATGDNRKAALADALNGLLADSYALYLKTKGFHWHVTGPHFPAYHALFDEQAAEILAMTDPIAERVRKLGLASLRSIGDVARLQTITDVSGEMSANDMLGTLRNDNVALADRLRGLKALCQSVGDNATEGTVDSWTDEAEARAWMLGATLGPDR